MYQICLKIHLLYICRNYKFTIYITKKIRYPVLIIITNTNNVHESIISKSHPYVYSIKVNGAENSSSQPVEVDMSKKHNKKY